MNKTDENQDFRKGFFLIEGPVCGRRLFQDCTERPAAAVVGSNGLIHISLSVLVLGYVGALNIDCVETCISPFRPGGHKHGRK